MSWHKVSFFTVAMAMAVVAAPQSQQIPAASQQQAAAGTPVAQSRDAPVYSDGYSSAGYGGAGVSAYSNGASYSQPTQQASYGGQQSSASSYGGGNGAGSGTQGYYYYYYPVQQESKTDYHASPSETYAATDSYGIDPIGIISVLAVAGLVIAGLALLFPGWAYVRSDESVYYRSNDAAPSSFLGLTKDDYLTLTSLVVSAVEGERCMDKMMCDAGKLVRKVKRAETFLRMMEDFAPTAVAEKIKKLRLAIMKGDECKKVKCSKKKM